MTRTTAVVVAGIVALAAAGGGIAIAEGRGAPLTPAQATSQWASANSGQFSDGVTTLLRDARWVNGAIAHREAATPTYCLYLYQDAEGENTDLLPTPDHQLTGLLSSAYDGFVRAAVACYAHTASASVLEHVAAEVRSSVSELTEAVLREEAITGVSLHLKGIP